MAAVAKGEGKETAAGCKLRLVGCRRDGGTKPWWRDQAMLAAGSGHKVWSQLCSTKTAPVAAWLQPAEQSVLQVGKKRRHQKDPKTLYVRLIFKREFTCVVC